MTTKSMRHSSRQVQCGQALTEFTVVGIFVLVPLFLLIPVIAKIISQSHDTQLAARYAAWERTVWYDSERNPPHPNAAVAASVAKSDGQISREIDARIYARDSESVRTASEQHFELDPFFHHIDEDATPLLRNEGSNEAPEYATQQSSESSPAGMAGKLDSALAFMGAATRFRMNTNGVFDASVSIPLIDLRGIFGLDLDVLANLSLRAENTIFAEAWEAGGTEHAKYVIGGLTPQQYLDNRVLRNFQNAYSHLPYAEELHNRCLYPGYASVEPVPEHRLRDFPQGVRGVGDNTGCSM